MCQLWWITWWPVLMVFNATFNKLSVIKCTPWWTVLLMFNVTFNNVSVYDGPVLTCNDNKFYCTPWYCFWCLMPLSTMCQLWWITWWPVLLVFNATFNKLSAINVHHGELFYWCLMPLSTMCQLWWITWWPVLMVFNATFNNCQSVMMDNVVTSFIDI